MYAVIYRGFVKAGCEQRYLECWRLIADYFVSFRGALGSSLHKGEDNEYIAYSRWPDRETRENSWKAEPQETDLPEALQTAIQELKNCIDFSKPYSETSMDVIDIVHK